MGEPRKKICLVTPGYPPRDWGGLARTAHRLAGHCRELGLGVQVAELTVSDQGPVLLDENVETERVDGATLHRIRAGRELFGGRDRTIWDCPHTYTLRMWYQSLKILHRKEGYDLFIAFFLYPMGYLTTLLARANGVPSMIGLMGNDINKYLFSPEKVGMCRAGLENADGIVSLSQEMIDLAHALTPIRDKAGLIVNSVALPKTPWRQRETRGRVFRFGFAGDFKYAKGLPYLLKAVAALLKQDRVELELAGRLRESERPVFEALKERTGLREEIRLRGVVEHGEMAGWLRSLDCFVLPSISEGCPNILLEAMACGLPCVATRVGAVPEMIRDGVSGLLVPAGDSKALARAMEEIIGKPREAAAMGRAARERVASLYSPEAERKGWEEAIRGLMEF